MALIVSLGQKINVCVKCNSTARTLFCPHYFLVVFVIFVHDFLPTYRRKTGYIINMA